MRRCSQAVGPESGPDRLKARCSGPIILKALRAFRIVCRLAMRCSQAKGSYMHAVICMVVCMVLWGNPLSIGYGFSLLFQVLHIIGGNQRHDRAHPSNFMLLDFGIL